MQVFGEFVSLTGESVGVPGPISSGSFGAEGVAVAFNGTNFLVAWSANDSFDFTLPTARLLDQNGNFLGPEIAVTISVLGSNALPSVALIAPGAGGVYMLPTNVTLQASAAGVPPLKVEFFASEKKIGEATSAPYTATWTPIKAGKAVLTAKVTDGNRKFTQSAPVSASVVLPVTFAKQPLPQVVFPGKPARFVAVAKGTAPLVHQWLFNGGVVTNATKPTLVIRAAQTNHVGSYSVRVTNPAGPKVSSAATLTLK